MVCSGLAAVHFKQRINRVEYVIVGTFVKHRVCTGDPHTVSMMCFVQLPA